MTDASASKASVDGSLRRFTEDRASEPDNPRHAGWPDLLQPASRLGQLRSGSAVAAEAHRVRPGRRQSLLPRVDDQAQRFQCLYAQNGLVNVPHEERGRGFTAIDPDNRDIGTEPHSPPIGEAHAHGSPRAPDPERAR